MEPDIGARRAGGRYLYDLATDADVRAEFGSDVYDLAVGAGSAMVGLPADLVALASLPHVVNNGGDVDEVFRIPGGSEWISEKLGADTSGLPWLAGQFLDPTGPALDAAKFVAAGAKNFDALALAGMTAWHGSPHKFDRFSLDKIGTGEGAQAYGHGLYFAEQKGVAKNYMQEGTPRYVFTGESAPEGLQEILDNMHMAISPTLSAEEAMETTARRIDELANQLEQQPAVSRQENLSAIASLREQAKIARQYKSQVAKQDSGNFYEVDIPDEAIDRMLDWDKPLSEQPDILEKLRNRFPRIFDWPSTKNSQGATAYHNVVGWHEWRDLPETEASKRASLALNEIGIPGIKYLDGDSRSAGEGTRNFVVFDENTVKVLSRNGEKLDAVP